MSLPVLHSTLGAHFLAIVALFDSVPHTLPTLDVSSSLSVVSVHNVLVSPIVPLTLFWGAHLELLSFLNICFSQFSLTTAAVADFPLASAGDSSLVAGSYALTKSSFHRLHPDKVILHKFTRADLDCFTFIPPKGPVFFRLV